MKIAVAPSRRSASAAGERIGRNPFVGKELRIAEDDAPPFDRAERAAPGRRVEVDDVARDDAAILRGLDDCQRERMLGRPLDRGGKTQQLGFVEAGRRHDG
jgi:hypothetical protein